MVSFGSRLKVHWIGKCGHNWEASVGERYRGSGCPVCNKKIIIQGQNDLATIKPQYAKEWDYEKNYPYTPNDVSGSSGKKFWWRCSVCGYEYQMSVNQRNKRRNCSKCANRIRGDRQKKKVRNIDTNKVFNSISEASQSVGLTPSAIGNCCKGIRKTAGGYHWEYV